MLQDVPQNDNKKGINQSTAQGGASLSRPYSSKSSKSANLRGNSNVPYQISQRRPSNQQTMTQAAAANTTNIA